MDFEAGSLHVRHQLRRERLSPEEAQQAGRRTQLVLRRLKTKRSRRTLHITPALDSLLRAHRARQAQERLAAGPEWADSDLVFTTKKGTPVDPDNFAHYFHRLCARAELGHWTPHELRHSAASIMLAQGTPLWVVSEVLGHASLAITKDVYGHLIGEEKKEATKAITDVLFGPRNAGRGQASDQRG